MHIFSTSKSQIESEAPSVDQKVLHASSPAPSLKDPLVVLIAWPSESATAGGSICDFQADADLSVRRAGQKFRTGATIQSETILKEAGVHVSECAQIIDVSKRSLKTRGLTYKDRAQRLGLSESSCERVFAAETFTLGAS